MHFIDVCHVQRRPCTRGEAFYMADSRRSGYFKVCYIAFAHRTVFKGIDCKSHRLAQLPKSSSSVMLCRNKRDKAPLSYQGWRRLLQCNNMRGNRFLTRSSNPLTWPAIAESVQPYYEPSLPELLVRHHGQAKSYKICEVCRAAGKRLWNWNSTLSEIILRAIITITTDPSATPMWLVTQGPRRILLGV